MAISKLNLDFYDDPNGETMAKVAMPQEMKGVPLEVLADEDRAKLNDSDFGLVILTKQANVLRKFPVNDPGNAWLSAQYFQENHAKLAFPARFIAAKFIKAACEAYEMPSSPRVDAYAARAGDEIEGNAFVEGSEDKWLLQKMAQKELLEKTASAIEMDAMLQLPDEHFALVIQNGDGSILRKYAMPNAEHVKMAAEYFETYATALPPEHRHNFASAVVRRAEELGVEVGDKVNLEKWASQNWNSQVQAHLEQRKSLLPRNPGAREVLDKLAAAIGAGETEPQDAAKALATFDEATGLTRYYDRGVTDPYASVMEKQAMSWSAEVDGQTITADDLRKVASSSKLAGYLGNSFAAQFAKDPTAIFDSLPTPEKVLIQQLVNGQA